MRRLGEDDRDTYDLRTLVSAMYRDLNKEHTAPDVDALVQFALTGQPLPRSFLVRLAGRNRADEYRVTRPRAVLSKMVLLSRNFKELDMDRSTLEALNPEQPEPAYHLGRLLAVLDDIQNSVMKANTTLVDRLLRFDEYDALCRGGPPHSRLAGAPTKTP